MLPCFYAFRYDIFSHEKKRGTFKLISLWRKRLKSNGDGERNFVLEQERDITKSPLTTQIILKIFIVLYPDSLIIWPLNILITRVVYDVFCMCSYHFKCHFLTFIVLGVAHMLLLFIPNSIISCTFTHPSSHVRLPEMYFSHNLHWPVLIWYKQYRWYKQS